MNDVDAYMMDRICFIIRASCVRRVCVCVVVANATVKSKSNRARASLEKNCNNSARPRCQKAEGYSRTL
jgi:hypothetical protein